MVPGNARAESLDGTRSGELMTERGHEIRVTLDRTDAELRVRRTVHNGGERHDQAVFRIDTPGSAAAVSLATLGMANNKPTWFPGKLMEAEEAARKYRELTGIGGYYPKDPALLSWRRPDELILQVFPVAPGTEKTVEYTFRMPMRYAEGRYHLELPETGTEDMPAEIAVFPARRTDQIFVDGEPEGRGAVVTLDRTVELSLARRDPARLEGALAVVATGADRHLVSWSIEAAAKISTIPKNARVVAILDNSRSMTAGSTAAQVTAARAYLQHFKGTGARAEVITFDRKVEQRLGGLRPMGEVLADLESYTPTARNGSQVDNALARARDVLGKSGNAPRRIVLFTDTLTRESLTVPRIATLARRTRALVHIVSVDPRGNSLVRDDDFAWAPAARKTGGLYWDANISAGELGNAHAVLEELARPMSIDNLEMRVAGLDDDDQPEVPSSLQEGSGLTELRLSGPRVRNVALEGEMWATKVRKVYLPSRAEGRRWAGMIFGDDLYQELSEPEMMVLAVHGQAVSPVTSYLAIEPGVRPSTEGLEYGRGSGLGFGGRGKRVPRVRQAKDRIRVSPEEALRSHMSAAFAACGSPDATGTLDIETTRPEIVAVHSLTLTESDPVLRDCAVEQLWATNLERGTFFRAHARFVVAN